MPQSSNSVPEMLHQSCRGGHYPHDPHACTVPTLHRSSVAHPRGPLQHGERPRRVPTIACPAATIAFKLTAQQRSQAQRQLRRYGWGQGVATNLTPALNACANPSHAYKADDSAALNAAFLNIAGRIAQLRLTK